MKNLYIKNISIFLSLSLLILIGCEDSIEGDTNIDPQSAEVIEPGLLLPQVLLSGLTAQRTIEAFAMNTHCQYWSFTRAFGVFVDPERYNIGPNTPNNIWIGGFTTALRNLDQMVILTERNNPTALNIIGQAEILKAFTFLNLTLTFGDIPFSEATQVADFPNPNFDTQEDVLIGIADIVDNALTFLETDTAIVDGAQDLLFAGDRESWIRFGNSIKLKALMLVANVDATAVSARIAEVATQPLIDSNEFEAKLDYLSAAGNQNPLWTLINQFAPRDDNGNPINNFYGGSTTMINFMNATNDPRRASYFDLATTLDAAGNEVALNIYKGQELGEFTFDSISPVSLRLIRPDSPDRYITASEINFNLAEAALLGIIPGDANTYYQNGIVQSLEYFDNIPGTEIPATEKAAYLTSPRGSIAGDSQADALRKIHEELWISDFNRGLEGWTDWRRNKVPDLEEVDGSIFPGEFIRRYQIPISEISSNPNAPDIQIETVPMWFEK